MENITNIDVHRKYPETLIITTALESRSAEIINNQKVTRVNISCDLSDAILLMNKGTVENIVVGEGPEEKLSEIVNALELMLPHYSGQPFMASLRVYGPEELKLLTTDSDLLRQKLVANGQGSSKTPG